MTRISIFSVRVGWIVWGGGCCAAPVEAIARAARKVLMIVFRKEILR